MRRRFPLGKPQDEVRLVYLLEVAFIRRHEDTLLQDCLGMVGGVVKSHAVALRQIKHLAAPSVPLVPIFPNPANDLFGGDGGCC